MTYSRQLRIVFGIAGALLLLLLPGCTRLIGREETPPPPVVTPQAVVTNLETGQTVAVTITDRGPYVKGRKIDLSRAAAQKIGMTKEGVAQVKIESRSRRKPTKKVARRRTKSHVTPVATRTDMMPTLPPQ
jgi:hypothetical protein